VVFGTSYQCSCFGDSRRTTMGSTQLLRNLVLVGVFTVQSGSSKALLLRPSSGVRCVAVVAATMAQFLIILFLLLKIAALNGIIKREKDANLVHFGSSIPVFHVLSVSGKAVD